MVNPINYIMDVKDPFESVMQGFSQGASVRRQPELEARERAAEERKQQSFELDTRRENQRFDQSEQTFQNQQTLFGQQQEAMAQQKAKAMQMQADLRDLVGNPNANAADYGEMILKYPELSSEIKSSFDLMDKPQKEVRLAGLSKLYTALDTGNNEIAKGIITDRIEAATNSGDEKSAAIARAMLQTFEMAPEAAKTMVGISLKGIGGSDYDVVMGGTGTVSKTKDFSDGTTLVMMNDGTRVVKDPAGNIVKGEDAARVIKEANQFEVEQSQSKSAGRETGKLKTQAELSAEAEGAKVAGKKGQELAEKAFESSAKTRANISNLNRAVELVETEGANSGVIQSKLPAWKASTIELRNMQNKLGLDVVGSVTFGALSKGELDLALATALPLKMEGPELAAWLKDKIVAQEKLADYLDEQARFLSKPGNTLNMWLDRDAPEAVTPQASTTLQSLLSKYGGGQ